ncbi:hypothetical protein [Demequina activiva]|uniref:Lipoprotein n=1 Tax=Demequina activiva TaxID=1582364 RepID=A0A919Q057_9MICO|nr:hypothetical protein [Demequina activiva]GIG53264.1 hypothetical protein Dac01nite_00160 [Demequina activiva]
MAPMRDPRWALTLAGGLLVAGCAAGADDVALASAPAPSATDQAVEVTTLPEVPIKDPRLHALAAMSGPFDEDGAMGGGCAVAEGESLADGDWFGYVIAYAPTALTLDIACVYGPDSEQYTAFAQAEDSDTHHYVVVNDVVEERDVRLTADTAVYIEALDWDPTDPTPAAHALDPEVVHEHRGVWVSVVDGDVVAIVEPAADVPPST